VRIWLQQCANDSVRIGDTTGEALGSHPNVLTNGKERVKQF
jgi:hypothetical protein